MENAKKPMSEFAIASLVLGIASFVQIMGTEKGILAIVFGILALRRLKKDSVLGGKKLAIAGTILGIVSVILVIVMTIIFMPKMNEMMLQMQQSVQ